MELISIVYSERVFCVPKLLIEGGKRLSGETELQGAKNSALPLMAACVACGGECLLHNCPCISDTDACIKILRYLGCSVSRHYHTVVIDSTRCSRCDIPGELMREMRGSIIFLGGLLARAGEARLSLPGGCELGPRPIDLHLRALAKMGVKISDEHGVIHCTAPKGLKGAKISLSLPSVGATENIMLAAVRACGTTTIINAACEPEITDLADFLNKCGAKIYGAGEGIIVIDGVTELKSAAHSIIPDRIVCATLMSAAAVTGSDIRINGVVAAHLGAVTPLFEEAGCTVVCKGGVMSFSAPQRLKAAKLIRTTPYPGFPTDTQAVMMAAMAVADGTTVFVENVFESRYKHVGELFRMGADIKVEGRVAVTEGVKSLSGAAVEAFDLRGAASLAVAGLAAQGQTEISGIKYLERGYENFEEVLSSLGASIHKV